MKDRAIASEKTIPQERAMPEEKTKLPERYTFEDILAVRLLVRAREDFQSMRKKMDNRIGRTAKGEQQNVEARAFRADDLQMFSTIADECKRQEAELEKNLKKVLKRFPIYTEYLLGVKGVGTISAGWIIAEFNIKRATTVSKMWQFAGLNSGQVRGNKDVSASEYKPELGEIIREYEMPKAGKRVVYKTGELIRGDKLSPGFAAPFNKKLRSALVEVMANNFIKHQTFYCMEFYYPYKERLAQEENEVLHVGKMKQWKEVTPGHRDRAAKRYMVKMFLKDLYVAWREIECLPVRAPYQEEYLGHTHE
jgi:hypothetical protein